MITDTFEKLPKQKQIQILDASARVFAQKGFFQAGIAELCKAAGISNGALYKYFQNKKGLYIAVAQRTLFLLREQADTIATKDASFWVFLRNTFEAVSPFTKKNKDYTVVYLDMGSPSMGELALELSNLFEKWSFEFLCQIAEDAISKGEIRKDLSIEDIAYFIDNHLLLFTFSNLSEHYSRRFDQFLGQGTGQLNSEQKIDRVMDSLRQFLR